VLTAELVRDGATLIFTTAFISAQAAKAVTTTVPIVFVSGPDPVQLGLVASLNRPGSNLTGVTLFTSTVGAKRLQLLRELLPSATTFAFIVNPNNTRADSDIQEMETAARALGQQIVVAKAGTDRDFETAFETLAQHSIQALVVGGDPFFNSQADQRDADGFSGRAAGVEQMGKVHGEVIRFDFRHSGMGLLAQTRNPEMISARFRVRAFSAPRNDGVMPYSAAWRWLRASRSSASSSTVWIGAKSRCAIYSGRVGVRM
jgi:hypothetical protein